MTNDQQGINSLYIHIPFCKKKCSYCDFVSFAGEEELIDSYVDALIKEISSLRSTFHSPLSTIYFGGGTPTLLKPNHFEKILETLTPFPSPTGRGGTVSDSERWVRELSVEANPGTINKDYLKSLRKLGINRISIGAQTFNDTHLKILGRIHNAKQIYQAVNDAKDAGFTNINLDLIFALPNQSLDEWKSDLKEALSLEPTHLSTYNLQIEHDTPLSNWLIPPKAGLTSQPANRLTLPSEDLDAEMYEYTIDTLKTHGYKHYEISNFAKPGFECKHNINYWLNGNYIGVGCGAHSHVNGKRWANTDDLRRYMSLVTSYESQVIRQETEDSRQETLFMGLRLIDGLPIEKFIGFEDKVNKLIKEGLLEKTDKNIRLTKKGLFLGNLVFEEFV